jgi:hypothetical protein
MTKRKKYSSLLDQPSLFDILKETEKSQSECPKGSLDIDSELRCAISEDLKHAQDPSGREISRYEVAARMSEYIGREITASMLNNWTAEAHENHNFPIRYLPAFVRATNQRHAFEVLSLHSGLFALPGPDALRANIHRIDEEIQKKRNERKKWNMYLKEMGERS